MINEWIGFRNFRKNINAEIDLKSHFFIGENEYILNINKLIYKHL